MRVAALAALLAAIAGSSIWRVIGGNHDGRRVHQHELAPMMISVLFGREHHFEAAARLWSAAFIPCGLCTLSARRGSDRGPSNNLAYVR